MGGLVVAVREELDIFEACRAVRALSERLGFPRVARSELAIVVAELASNILKHAVRGTISGAALHDPLRGLGIQITACDEGVPIRHIGMAVLDGCDELGPIPPDKLLGRRGAGVGLGAVLRMTDTFEHTALDRGNRFRVVRYLDHRTQGQLP